MRYTARDYALMAGMLMVALAFVLTSVCGCDDGCKHLDTRCRGNVIEICDADNNWRFVENCEALEPYEGEVCCWEEQLEVHLCLLPDECGRSGVGDYGLMAGKTMNVFELVD